MKVVFSIAKNEFRYLFYSPIAWFVLLVFLVQCGYFYVDPIYNSAIAQDLHLKNSPSFKGFPDSLTRDIFLRSEFFLSIIKNLFLFIPILTMGLISRETNSGTNALLYSSPVPIRYIVLGKYVGILMYNLLLVLVIAMFIVAGMLSIKDVDYNTLLSALLGFYLLVCAYSAIGLFMSSLSSHQIVSALGTFIVIFLLSEIGGVWQRYDGLRDITWFLSLQNRTFNMLKGLIVTKDIIYFVLVSFMFLAFTYFKLSGILQYRPWIVRTSRYLVTIAIVLLVGYFCSRPAVTGYFDTTYTQRNTLNPVTQQLLRAFGDSTLEITLYTNLLGDGMKRGLPEGRNADYLANFWESYLRFKPDIKLNYVYYYANDPSQDDSAFLKKYPGKSIDEIARGFIDMIDADADMFQSEANMKPVANLRAESNRVVMQLRYQGRSAFLRTYNDVTFWPLESHTIAALHRVLGTPMPNVSFSSGSMERSIYKYGEREYAHPYTDKLNRFSLMNLGFNIDTVNLNTQAIAGNSGILVIADPKVAFNSLAQEKINEYIRRGGNLIALGEPGKQDILNPVLSQLGVELSNGQLVYPSLDETPEKVVSIVTKTGKERIVDFLSWKKRDKYFEAIIMPSATAVSITRETNWKSNSLAETVPNKSWIKMEPLVVDSTLPPFNAQAGDLEQVSFSTMQELTRMIDGKKQHVVIAGDADFMSNSRYSGQFVPTMAIFSSMNGNMFPNLPSLEKYPKDLLLTIGERTAYYQKIFFVWILPGVVLLAGAVLLIRRKRK